MLRDFAGKLRKCLKKFSFKKRHSFVLSIIFVATLVIGYTVLTQKTKAEGSLDINILFRWLIEIMFWLSTVFMKFAIFFLELFINLAKYNNYVNAPTVIIGWLLVRDVANMFFVVVLLAIAIGTILGIEQYEWKKTLVKFVFAAIFINFSKLICGLIIDVAHVFTITFLNAVQALAGGNLISMFKMSEVQSMLENTDPITRSDNFVYALFASAVLALVMSGVSMVAIGAYAIVMLARVVVLWVLIILSPLAFIMGVIPQAQAYSKQIWDKFGKQVMVAPVMVFFLWLSFATLGSGDAASQFGMDSQSMSEAAGGLNTVGTVDVAKESDNLAVTISKAGTWENLASYMVAIAFMLVGINVVQGMGVVAGGLVQKAQDFAGSVAKIATGYALGRKIAGAAWTGAKKGAGKLAWNMPLIGGERWALLGKTIGNNILASYKRAGTGITKQSIMTGNEIAQLQGEKSQIVNAGELLASKKARYQELSLMEADGKLAPDSEEYKELHGKRDEDGNMVGGLEEDIKRLETTANMNPEDRKAAIAKKNEEIKALQDRQKTEVGGPIGKIFGSFARSQAAQRKHLRKSQGQAETLDKILSKRVGAEAGGWIFNRMGGQVEAQDRVERGILEAEDMRSKSKDDEFIKMGKAATLAADRQKWTGAGSFQKGVRGFLGLREMSKPMISEIAQRQRQAAGYESIIKALTAAQNISIDVNLRNKLNEAQKLAAAGDPHKLNVLLGKELPTAEELEAAKQEILAENEEKNKNLTISPKKLSGEKLEEKARERAGYDPLAVALMNEEMEKTAAQQQKEAHNNALMSLAGTDIGKEIYQAFAEAEVGAKIGEEFIKSIKSKDLRDKFKAAAEAMNKINNNDTLSETDKHHQLEQLFKNPEIGAFAAFTHWEEEAQAADKEDKRMRKEATKSLDSVHGKAWEDYYTAQGEIERLTKELADGKISPENFTAKFKEYSDTKKTAEEIISEGQESGKFLNTQDEKEAYLKEAGLTDKEITIWKETPASIDQFKNDWTSKQNRMEQELTIARAVQKPEEQTAQMRMAEAEIGTAGVDNYLKSVKRNWQRYRTSANVMDGMEEKIKKENKEIEKLKEDLEGVKDPNKRAAIERQIADKKLVVKNFQGYRDKFLQNDTYAGSVYWEKAAMRSEKRDVAQKSRALENFARSDKGKEIINDTALANLFATIGEELVKGVENLHIKDVMNQKFQALGKAIRRDDSEEAMARLATSDALIRSLINKADSGEEEGVAKIIQADVTAQVKGQYIDMKKRNFTTPPTERLEYWKKSAAELKQLDETGRGNALAKATSLLTQLSSGGKPIDERTRNEIITALVACNADGNIDDAFSSMAGMANQWDSFMALGGLKAGWQKNDKLRSKFSDADIKRLRKTDVQAQMTSLKAAAEKYGWIEKQVSKSAQAKAAKEIAEYQAVLSKEAIAQNGGQELNEEQMAEVNKEAVANYDRQMTKEAVIREMPQLNDPEIEVEVNKRIEQHREGLKNKKKAELVQKGINEQAAETEAQKFMDEHGTDFSYLRHLDYEFVDSSDSYQTAKLQTYVVTGGDEEFVDTQFAILHLMEKENIKNFKEAATKFFEKLKTDANGVKNEYGDNKYLGDYDELEGKLKKYQDSFQNVAEAFKNNAIDIGHYQLGGNIYLDENIGMLRAMNREEHSKIIGGTTVKRDGLRPNPQGVGRYLNSTGFMERLNRDMIAISSCFQATTVPSAEKSTMIRTRRTILGLHKEHAGEKDDNGYAQLSDSTDHIMAAGEGDYLVGLMDQMTKIHAVLAADGKNSVALLSNIEFQHTDRFAAEAGELKATIAGYEEWIRQNAGLAKKLNLKLDDMKFDTVEEYARKIKVFFENNNVKTRVKGILESKIEAARLTGDKMLVKHLQDKLKDLMDGSSEEMQKALEKAAVEAHARYEEGKKHFKDGKGEKEKRDDGTVTT